MASTAESRSIWSSNIDRLNAIPIGMMDYLKDHHDDEDPRNNADMIVVIESRVLIRDCISKSIAHVVGEGNVYACADIDQWIAEKDRQSRPTLILYCIGRRGKLDDETLEKFARIGDRDLLSRVVLMSDGEDADGILDALEQGVRGYIPTSVSLEVAIEAMRLVRAGGVYVPASSMIAARLAPGGVHGRKSRLTDVFTPRQAEVVEALRQGKANKVIAYELDMQESTVKVHVRNIMKKLRARNRTEVAYLTRGLFDNGDE
jgi:DNA-binding NarL/FixJ family response regulator